MFSNRKEVISDILLGLAVLIVSGLVIFGVLSVTIVQLIAEVIAFLIIVAIASYLIGSAVRSLWVETIKQYVHRVFRRK